MAAKGKRVTVKGLVKAIEDTPLKVVERARVEGKDVYGFYDGDSITVGIQGCRASGRANKLILTLVHEALHAYNEKLSEAAVESLTLVFFKSMKVREAASVKLINVVLFNIE
jgi:hypothetical protein